MYAYDPVSRKMIMTRPIQLTTGYDPSPLRLFPVMMTSGYQAARDALVNPPSSYVKHVTWTYDPDTKKWELLGPTPQGVDTLLSTPYGVMGVNVNWRSRLNDAGYQLPWNPAGTAEDKAIYLLELAAGRWNRLGPSQPSPQNLYEQTSLAYDEKRRQILLHGAGKNREELWIFEMATHRWKKMQLQIVIPEVEFHPSVLAKLSAFLKKMSSSLLANQLPRGNPSLQCGLTRSAATPGAVSRSDGVTAQGLCKAPTRTGP